jgi:histidinol-phosphate aminotransferase
VLPSSANYVFVSADDRDGKRLYQKLFEHNILVRHFDDPALTHGVRISIGTREDMGKTLEVLS